MRAIACRTDPERLDVLASVEVLLASGERRGLTEAERREVLQRVRAGEHVELTFRARTFYQDESPNRNFVRFQLGALEHLARSFKGQPFLRDHSHESIGDRGGTIERSELSRDENTAAIDMEIRAVKGWAVEGLLDGTIDRFSIGWQSTSPIKCSVHKKPISVRDGGCGCWPGDEVDGATVEAVFTSADGVEVSAVNVPAVREARGVEIRAALAAAFGGDIPRSVAALREETMKTLASLVGLAAAATEEEISAAVGRLRDERESLAIQLAAAREKSSAIESRLAVLEADRKAAEERATAEHVEARIKELKSCGALALARDEKGDAAMSNGERLLRSAAARGGITEFEAAAADFKPGTFAPSGQIPQLRVEERAAGGAGDMPDILRHPEVQRRLAAAGLTAEQVIKSNGLGQLAEGGR